jgi:hypothetical protein
MLLRDPSWRPKARRRRRFRPGDTAPAEQHPAYCRPCPHVKQKSRVFPERVAVANRILQISPLALDPAVEHLYVEADGPADPDGRQPVLDPPAPAGQCDRGPAAVVGTPQSPPVSPATDGASVGFSLLPHQQVWDEEDQWREEYDHKNQDEDGQQEGPDLQEEAHHRYLPNGARDMHADANRRRILADHQTQHQNGAAAPQFPAGVTCATGNGWRHMPSVHER